MSNDSEGKNASRLDEYWAVIDNTPFKYATSPSCAHLRCTEIAQNDLTNMKLNRSSDSKYIGNRL